MRGLRGVLLIPASVAPPLRFVCPFTVQRTGSKDEKRAVAAGPAYLTSQSRGAAPLRGAAP